MLQVRQGMALALILQRTLVLPMLTCFCDRHWCALPLLSYVLLTIVFIIIVIAMLDAYCQCLSDRSIHICFCPPKQTQAARHKSASDHRSSRVLIFLHG